MDEPLSNLDAKLRVQTRTRIGLSSSQRGDQVSLVPKPQAVHLFDTATGLRLADA